ncbi:MAG: CotH kinase family protein [Bacillota bacterium]
MKINGILVKIILILCVTIAVVIFTLTYLDSSYKVEKIATPSTKLDMWSLKNSEYNGAPLYEDKNIYDFSKNGQITSLYISVFPTQDKNGVMRTFKSLDLITQFNKSEIFDLDANVIYGEPDGKLNPVKNPDIVNAIIKDRGGSSLSSANKSFKLNLLDSAETFYGQKTLNINKHAYDVSKISNKFCMDMLSTLPSMSSLRTNFMILYIRDTSLPKQDQTFKYYGLYTHVEQPNKTFLKAHGLDVNGSLYKAVNFEFKMSPALKNYKDPGFSLTEFAKILEPKEGTDNSKLIEMVKAVNDPNQDFAKIFKTYFNEDNYLSWIACNILLGNEDTISQNFILYNPQNSLTWYFMPWDYDGTFKIGKYASHYEAPPSLKGVQRLSGVELHRRYFRYPGNMLKLSKKIKYIFDNYMTEKKVQALVDSYKPVLEKTMTIMPDLRISRLPPNEINSYLNGFYKNIQQNYNYYLESIKYPSPVFVSDPKMDSAGKVTFAWEPSFDYNGTLISYDVAFYYDPTMLRKVFSASNITQTQYTYGTAIKKGTYYLKISIRDTNGNVQRSFDFFSGNLLKPEFGLRQVTFR